MDANTPKDTDTANNTNNTNYTNSPISPRKKPNRLIRYFLFILGWCILAIAFSWFFQPKPKPVSNLFYVCVMQDNEPTIMQSKDIPTSNPAAKLCQQPYNQNFNNSVYRMEFDKIKASDQNAQRQEWQLKTWTDSIGDPYVFRYEVDTAGKVYPLWYTYGGWSSKLMAWIYALIAMTILWKIFSSIGKKIDNRKTKDKGDSCNNDKKGNL